MAEVESLPLAEELVETPSTIKTLVESFLKRPDQTTASVILDWLDDEQRQDDAREFLVILRRLCAQSHNGKSSLSILWHQMEDSVRQLFWFDLYGFGASLDAMFVAVEKMRETFTGGTAGSAITGSIALPITSYRSAFTTCNSGPPNGNF